MKISALYRLALGARHVRLCNLQDPYDAAEMLSTRQLIA
jgi:hypothetical protein